MNARIDSRGETATRANSGSDRPVSVAPFVLSWVQALLDGGTVGGDWQERALCSQTDPEAFFPEKGGTTRDAKRICERCEVRAQCLEYALAHDERFGVWGGLSERERRRLKQGVSHAA
jgi:WhiB family redox-sensing transcriptional regulator